MSGSLLDDLIMGTPANQYLHGLLGDDTINGAGGNDTLTGGRGSDTFLFGPNWGSDTITDFDPAFDQLSFSSTTTSFTALIRSLTQSSDGVVISDGEGNSITFTGYTLEDFDEGWLIDTNHSDLITDFIVSPSIPVSQSNDNDNTSIITAQLSDGGYVVVWANYSSPAQGSRSVKARTFDSNGNPTSSEITVSHESGNNQNFDVTALDNGGFAITWFNFRSYNGYSSVYDSSGNLVSGPNIVTDSAAEPGIFSLNDGGYIVLTGPSNIDGIRFDANGQQIGEPITFSENFVSSLNTVGGAQLPNGNIVTFWDGVNDNDTNGIVIRMFNANMEPISGEMFVNVERQDIQWRPDIAILANGNFVITWDTFASDDRNDTISYRIYDPNGNALTEEYSVNSEASHNQENASVTALESGFIITWTNEFDDLLAQKFDTVGNPISNAQTLITNDTYIYNYPAITALGNGLINLIWLDTNGDVVSSTINHNRNYTNASMAESIIGNNSANIITGFAGNDTLDGYDSDDTLIGGIGADTLIGGIGNDILYAGVGDDLLNGEDDNDILIGHLGNDSLLGEDGNDLIRGGAGIDTMDGGNGHDTIWAGSGDTAGDIIYGGGGDDLIGSGAGPDLVSGGNGSDTVYGGADNDTIWGGDTNNNSESSADIIWSGSGDDLIHASAGADTMGGGAGDDTIYAEAGDDIIYGGKGDGDDTGINDIIDAGAGNDTIYGGSGDDYLIGEFGNDLIYNGNGDDTVSGGYGNDTLWGGNGHDQITGGSGSDTFSFSDRNGHDIVTDFNVSGDILLLQTSHISSLSDLEDISVDTEGALLISFTSNDSITLEGLSSGQLASLNIVFA